MSCTRTQVEAALSLSPGNDELLKLKADLQVWRRAMGGKCMYSRHTHRP